MARFTVNIACDGAAFEPEPVWEIARILSAIAERIASDGLTGFYQTILDANGNDVGRFALKNDDGSNWNGTEI